MFKLLCIFIIFYYYYAIYIIDKMKRFMGFKYIANTLNLMEIGIFMYYICKYYVCVLHLHVLHLYVRTSMHMSAGECH